VLYFHNLGELIVFSSLTLAMKYQVFSLSSSIKLCTLKRFDKEAYNQVTEKSTELTDTLYFNKGL